MAKRPLVLETDRFDEELVDFRSAAAEPIELRELANSFAAIDAIYTQPTKGRERLAIVQLRTGSIIATVAPFVPIMGHMVIALDAAMTLTDFTKRMKKALDAFSGIEPSPTELPNPGLAREIAELIRPLTGKNGASFGFTRIRAKSKTGQRTLEVEAEYGLQQIDRAYINAERAFEAPAPIPFKLNDDSEPALVRGVDLVLHQTNVCPAKEKGQTGDEGVIASVTDKPLPLYFASSISNLKERLVRAKLNPLLQHLNVDAWVVRDNGVPKSYTIMQLHDPQSGFTVLSMPR